MIMDLIRMIQNKETTEELAEELAVDLLSVTVKADFISRTDSHLVVGDSLVEPNSKCIFNTFFISYRNCTKAK